MSEDIDYNTWVTQQALADELTKSLGYDVTIQRVHNWVQRKKIATKKINELGITLVNRFSINVKTINN